MHPQQLTSLYSEQLYTHPLDHTNLSSVHWCILPDSLRHFMHIINKIDFSVAFCF